MTATNDTREGRDVMAADVPNAFIQAMMPKLKKGEDRVVTKITGDLVDLLIELDPTYENSVTIENGKRVLHTIILRAIYGMLESAMLYSTRSFEVAWRVLDLNLICTMAALQIEQSTNGSIRLDSMLMISC